MAIEISRCLKQIDPIGPSISSSLWGDESNSFYLHLCFHRLGVNQFYRVQVRSTSLQDMAAIKIAESITENGDVEKIGLPKPLQPVVLGWFRWLNAGPFLDD